LIEEFDKMTEEFAIEVVNTRKSSGEIQEMQRVKIEPVLANGTLPHSRSSHVPT